MQGDIERVRKELEEIVERLEEVKRLVGIKSIERAIEELKIAIGELESPKRKSTEGLDHYSAKVRLIEELMKDGGTCYLESEQTKLSKIGYRPDAVIVKDDEVIFVEIETDQRRMLRKLKKIKKLWDRIIQSPILTGRRFRIIFGITDENVKNEVISEVKKLNNVEIYTVLPDRVVRIL